MEKIRQILFVPPAPLVWADHLGTFAKHGIVVETTSTLSSDQIGQGLADGAWDVGIGAVDNVIAWNSERNADLRIVAQLERTIVMRFCCAPGYADLPEVARDVIAVDSTTNGFVLVLYRALARAGIDWRRCRFDPVGGVRQRFEAMIAGKASSSILVPPFDEMASARGFKVLWRGEDIAPHYPGVVLAVGRRWLAANGETLRRYLAALLDANEWAARSGNAVAARTALATARYSAAAAARLVDEIVPGLAPSLAGWDEVVALRRECGLLPEPAPDPAAVIDRETLHRARTIARS
jgi:ABC-type nitrate/sulfonate/bicarbonate transport system substrate-binding protein